RRRQYLVPQSAQARRGHREDRRRLRAKPQKLRRRPRLRAHADRPGAPPQPRDGRGMGAGRGGRGAARGLGLRLSARGVDWPRVGRTAVGHGVGEGVGITVAVARMSVSNMRGADSKLANWRLLPRISLTLIRAADPHVRLRLVPLAQFVETLLHL